MPIRRPLVAVAAASWLSVSAATALAQPPNAAREIQKLNGDVYWARDNDLHLSIFMVTPEGIVVADPINREFSTWLKSELAARFDVPVRYVLYSHKDYDHASGADVFADTAKVVAHENTSRHLGLPPANTPLPESAAALDANGNGKIEQGEAKGQLQSLFALHDANKDAALSGAEVTRGPLSDVRAPDVTFSKRTTITLGGKRAEMIHIPIEHADDNSIVLFPDDDAVFVVDFALVDRLPFGTLVGEVDQIKQVEALAWQHFVPGHGHVGTRASLAAHRRYREELRAAVAAGLAQGRTLDELKQSVTMDQYKDWEFYQQWRADNVTGMYQILTAR
jgi:glyoxylase-like metal-dependent hydrolase (beta-lactamase superfamily II)